METPDITAKGMSEHTGFSFFVFAREAGSLLISGPNSNVDLEGKANCIQTPLIPFYGYKTFPFAGSLFRRNTKSPGFLKIQGMKPETFVSTNTFSPIQDTKHRVR